MIGRSQSWRLVVALAAVACSDGTTAPRESRAVEIVGPNRPAWLSAAQDSLKRCYSGIAWVGQEDVRFFVAPRSEVDYSPNDGVSTVGRAWLNTRVVYIEKYAVQHPRVWMHELAHVIFQVQGHPSNLFEACGLIGLGPGDTTLTKLVYLLD